MRLPESKLRPRSILNGLYNLCGGMACIALALTGVIVLAQIIGRVFGVLIPSADDFAGYSMGASTFLGLAYTFRADRHIRVNLLTQRLPQAAADYFEVAMLALGLAMLGYLTWANARMTYLSYDFGSLSTGLVPVPLWIPQTVITFGVFVMTVSMLDAFVLRLANRTLSSVKTKTQSDQGDSK